MLAAVPVRTCFNYALLIIVVPKNSEEEKLHESSCVLRTTFYPCVKIDSGCLGFFMYKGASVA